MSLEMPFDTIIKVAGDLYSAGVYEIRCTGGEPSEAPLRYHRSAVHNGILHLHGTNGIYSLNILKKVMKAQSTDYLSIDGSTE